MWTRASLAAMARVSATVPSLLPPSAITTRATCGSARHEVSVRSMLAHTLYAGKRTTRRDGAGHPEGGGWQCSKRHNCRQHAMAAQTERHTGKSQAENRKMTRRIWRSVTDEWKMRRGQTCGRCCGLQCTECTRWGGGL
eukprot:scaffold56308_cov61-Phaeocystis_antarctica.AAC.6